MNSEVTSHKLAGIDELGQGRDESQTSDIGPALVKIISDRLLV